MLRLQLNICAHLIHAHSVSEGIRSHDPEYRVIAQNYPLFLWKDNIYDDDSPYTGFLRSTLLVKVRALFVS